MQKLNVVLIDPKAKVPSKSSPDELGWDISCVAEENWILDRKTKLKKLTLMRGESHTFHTGFKMSGQGFLLRDRSGMGCKDIVCTAGVIDSTYTGEWMVHLINLGEVPYDIFEGDRIIQAIPIDVIPCEVCVVDSLEDTSRGEKGFGSSGR